jgi:hypothetical protein
VAAAYAIENVLKGLIAFKRPGLIQEHELHGELKTHDLNRLSRMPMFITSEDLRAPPPEVSFPYKPASALCQPSVRSVTRPASQRGRARLSPLGSGVPGTTNESPAPGAGGAWSLGDSTHWRVSRKPVVIAQQFSNLFPGAIQRPYLRPTKRLRV